MLEKRSFATLLLALTLVGATAFASPEDKKADDKKADEKAPKIAFKTDTVETGPVMRGDDAKFEFVFTNQGGADLTISDVKTSCGCTAANKADLVGKVFKPGETGTVLATMTTKNLRGPSTKTITVTSNDPVDPQKRLTAKANVTTLIDITPSDRVFFRIDKGEEAPTKKIITLSADKANAFKITSLEPSSELITARVLEADKTEAAKAGENAGQPATEQTGEAQLNPLNPPKEGDVVYQIELDVVDKPPVGTFNGTVKVNTTHPKLAQIELHVNGQVLGQVSVNPVRIYLGKLDRDKAGTIERKVRVIKKNSTDFKIENVTSSDPAIQVKTMEVEAGRAFDIIMTLATDKLKDGNLNANIEVKTNDKEQPSIQVPVTAVVAAAS